MKMKSQIDRVKKELKRKKLGITPQDMLPYGIMRLGDIIYKLRGPKHWWHINTIKETRINKVTGRKSTYARYVLISQGA